MKMKWQNRRRLAGRMVGLVTASVLAIGCIIAAPVFGGTAHAAPTLDLEQECKLQVKVEAKAMTDDGEAEMPDVVIDLYKVADVEKVEGYDAYTFENLDAFSGLDFNITVDRDADHSKDYEGVWKPLAQQTAMRIFDSFGSGDPIAPVVEGGEPNANLAPEGASDGLEPGLYLMVARGRDLSPAEYVVRDTEAQTVATIAYSDSYTFTSSPQLVALPTKDSVNGEVASSNPGEWKYEYELGMELKFGVSERYGVLAIDKVLQSYLTGDPAVFVFSVEATVPAEGGGDRVVYSDVVSMTFSSAESQSVLLAADFENVDTTGYDQLKTAKIPVGAKVVVTEVYSGQTYAPVNGVTVHTVDSLSNARPGEAGFADTNGASFRNEYDGTGRKGSAITNHFEYIDDGAGLVWDLTQIPSAAPAPAPSPTPEVAE